MRGRLLQRRHDGDVLGHHRRRFRHGDKRGSAIAHRRDIERAEDHPRIIEAPFGELEQRDLDRLATSEDSARHDTRGAAAAGNDPRVPRPPPEPPPPRPPPPPPPPPPPRRAR